MGSYNSREDEGWFRIACESEWEKGMSPLSLSK